MSEEVDPRAVPHQCLPPAVWRDRANPGAGCDPEDAKSRATDYAEYLPCGAGAKLDATSACRALPAPVALLIAAAASLPDLDGGDCSLPRRCPGWHSVAG